MAYHANTCPICEYKSDRAIQIAGGSGSNVQLRCPNCKEHSITQEAIDDLSVGFKAGLVRGRLAHGVCKLDSKTLITTDLLSRLEESVRLPEADECLDNLVMYLAHRRTPGESMNLAAAAMLATIGVPTSAAAIWAIQELASLRWIMIRSHSASLEFLAGVTLTSAGWARYHALMSSAEGSRHAFMAMKFNDPAMDDLFRKHLVPAVAMTGFELRRTDGPHASAGLIDNRMRVEIRTSRFLVCDLSHGNQGAYWEAGFAEGLGRPVFYTCSEEAFSDPARKPHFDADHQAIIKWDENAPSSGMQDLKSMIRATLPAEAQLEDNDAK